jgi:hypothetical protein
MEQKYHFNWFDFGTGYPLILQIRSDIITSPPAALPGDKLLII